MIRSKSSHWVVIVALMCATVTVPLLALTVTPQDALAEAAALSAAQSFYDSGKFTEAVTGLKEAIAQGKVTGSENVRAKELLGRCQAKAGDAAGAKATFLGLLRQDPLYRLDALRTPPDEVEPFKQALRTFEAEQLAASRRTPASLTLFYGVGAGGNKDFGEYVAIGGGDDKFKNKPMFGLGVRFPIRPRWSLDLEIQRFRATNEDSASGSLRSTYELSALPIIVSLFYSVHDAGKVRAGVFVGGGPMLNSYASDIDAISFAPTPISITDSKTGMYLHVGVEAEYELHPKLALTARALVRSAKASKMYGDLQFNQYGPVGTLGTLGNRDLDFSGYGLSIGLRGYIGY